MPSRNPFADPNLPSLAELIERIGVAQTLPLSQQQNMFWGIRLVARASGKTPAQVPAHPEYLRNLLNSAAPASLGISKGAWNNARSLTGKALRFAGLSSMPAHYQAPFAPAWADLWDRLPPGKNALRYQLSRLMHFCSAQEIAPAEVSDDVFKAFHDALRAESIVKNPDVIYRGAAKSWNNAAERISDWPQQRVSVPSWRQVFSLPWHLFPATLWTSVEAYLRRAKGLDLSDDHFVRAQRPATLRTREHQLRLLATAIHKSGVPIEMLVDLRAMLAPEVAVPGLQFLLARNDGASNVQLSNLGSFLPTLARRLDMPDEQIRKLRNVAKKLRVVQCGMTTRNREALRAFDDQEMVSALVNLPARIWEDVRASGRQGYKEAKLIQTALAIDLLLNAPVRIQNLASIEIDRHFVPVGARQNRSVHLRFPASEVKNSNDLEFPLLPAVTDLLDTYLREWLPRLSEQGRAFLFPGKKGETHKGTGPLSAQIKSVVHAYTGLDMPAHRFRHAVGKIYLDRNPGQYEVVRRLLGHKDISTTTSFYTGAESASAARHYAKTILELREAASRLKPRKKRSA